jgi:hypothetical protein
MLFGRAPLVEGEDEAVYHEFFERISNAVKQRDFLEEIWVRDVVDLSWDALRMRRIKAQVISYAKTYGRFEDQHLKITVDGLERIDRMILSAEARRNNALREIERHRISLAEALRRATDNLVEAKYAEVLPAHPR